MSIQDQEGILFPEGLMMEGALPKAEESLLSKARNMTITSQLDQEAITEDTAVWPKTGSCLREGSLPSLLQRKDQCLTLFRGNKVGPGTYKVDKGLLNPERGISIGKAERKPLTDFQETGTIGPGVYHRDNGGLVRKFQI